MNLFDSSPIIVYHTPMSRTAKLPQKSNKSSDDTRKRLIEAAMPAFAEHGFSAVSTRELAKSANTNLSAIPYHFNGKEGLYHAVLETIIEEAQACCGSVAEKIRHKLESAPQITLAKGEPLIRELIQTIVSFLVSKGKSRHRATLIIRELTTPSDGFQQLYQGYMQEVHTTLTHLVAALLHENPDSTSSVLRAHALLGQVIFFSAGRELIKARTDGKKFTQSRLDEITTIVTETFTSSILAMRQERGIHD